MVGLKKSGALEQYLVTCKVLRKSYTDFWPFWCGFPWRSLLRWARMTPGSSWKGLDFDRFWERYRVDIDLWHTLGVPSKIQRGKKKTWGFPKKWININHSTWMVKKLGPLGPCLSKKSRPRPPWASNGSWRPPTNSWELLGSNGVFNEDISWTFNGDVVVMSVMVI